MHVLIGNESIFIEQTNISFDKLEAADNLLNEDKGGFGDQRCSQID